MRHFGPMRHLLPTRLSALIALALGLTLGPAHADGPRDEFFWLGEINKASAVINTEQGLLDRRLTPLVTAGLRQVLRDGQQPGAKRPASVITFEPLLIQAAGPEITWLHAGRSSQDMHATFRAAILRDEMLRLAEQLNATRRTLIDLADQHRATIVPNYTNGVAAQPNSYGHNLLGHAAGLERDAQRLREAYARIDRSPMGSTVLNGSSWPLDRARMADYLGFAALVENAYDAGQISSVDEPVEAAALATSLALHTGQFIEDVMTQYAQARPWILLEEGGANTYVSSAMPQKRNPGLLNATRRDASSVLAQAHGVVLQAHNIPPGMSDAKEVKPNTTLLRDTGAVLKRWQQILQALRVNRERALDELNSDWTASQELADVLMRRFQLPFRVGHHFASEVVEYARAKDIRPLDFPYREAQRIYAETVQGSAHPAQLPLSEAEFRATLDPVAIVNNRATVGGPQPAEMTRMLARARQSVAEQETWVRARREHVQRALARLDQDFDRLADSAASSAAPAK